MSWSQRVQNARASRNAALSDDELLTLKLAVASDASLAQRLSVDQSLLTQLTEVARCSSSKSTTSSSPSVMMTAAQVTASWLCCALGAPPSSNASRGVFSASSFQAMIASRLGRMRGTASRRPEDGVRILALDGGGTRALVTIEMLKELERQSGQRVHELFDVIAGTSTGGILAVGIQERLTLEELERLYLDISTVIFAREPGWRVELLRTGGQYRVAKLESILKRTFPRLQQTEQIAAALTHDASVEAAAAAGGGAAAARGGGGGGGGSKAAGGGAGRGEGGGGGGGAAAGGDSSGWNEDNLSMLERRALQEASYAAEVAASRSSSPPPPRTPTPPPGSSLAMSEAADAGTDAAGGGGGGGDVSGRGADSAQTGGGGGGGLGASAEPTASDGTDTDGREPQPNLGPQDRLPPSRPPHVLIVASLTSTAPPTPFIFRNYEYPPEPAGSASATLSRHAGTSSVPVWQALRATTAAPSYFAAKEIESVDSAGIGVGIGIGEYAAAVGAGGGSGGHGGGGGVQQDGSAHGAQGAAAGDSTDDAAATAAAAAAEATAKQAAATERAAAVAAAAELRADGLGAIDADHPAVRRADLFPSSRSIFQDGGLLANNPSAIALHEARMLFPHAPIACLASFGTGAFPVEQARRPGSWSSVVSTIVRAATRTEEVHQMLSDLLPILSVPYYRFNPQVPPMRLDEISPPKLKELQEIGRGFVVSGKGKEDCAALARLLTTGRGRPARGVPGTPAASAVKRLRSWPASLLLKLGSRVRGPYSRL